MMIMITPQDFRRLSAGCQQELLSLLAPGESELPPREDEMTMPSMDTDQYGPMDAHIFLPLPPEESGFSQPTFAVEVADTGAKRVIDISIEQARELIANVSERSQDALKLFAAGPAVPLATLVGPTAPYRDFNDLKRSLVGAVNRRLRTVTENRAAVLFSSDRDKTRIRITPLSAVALRQVLQMPEPLPEFAFFDRIGQAVSASTESAIAFQTSVRAVWHDLSLRPLPGQVNLTADQTIRYLADHGFAVMAGKPVADDDGQPTLRYEFMAGADLISLTDQSGTITMATVEGAVHPKAFLVHPAHPDVFAALAEV
ncbi:MAG: hypothetical protein IPN53_04390 [Comamonadaceae bacterium]|nr:hypothetical protein [Comamonadaceae bacterium]